MRHVIGLIILFSLLCLTGCATYFYQEGKTLEECKQDRLECFEELKKYSSHWQDMGEYEFKFMEDCMQQKGYRLVRESKLPLRVKRIDPDRLLHYRLHGIAGTLEDQE